MPGRRFGALEMLELNGPNRRNWLVSPELKQVESSPFQRSRGATSGRPSGRLATSFSSSGASMTCIRWRKQGEPAEEADGAEDFSGRTRHKQTLVRGLPLVPLQALRSGGRKSVILQPVSSSVGTTFRKSFKLGNPHDQYVATDGTS